MHHQKISDKIKTWHEAADIIRLLKAEGKKAVFTNGCFDLLHKGHVDYLSKAADLGDLLIVGINTDESVKRLGKSLSRPIQDENSRAYIMAALESVGIVVMFNEDTPLELINMLRPDVLV
ncbi:MAG: adenylyltransferase/cytidyltransferase family protein, partial [Bacteroidia bacterium]|nr:adenylyltransferase/cytidyltransferase family protein [Bacteroidia bacterium]